MKLKKEILTFVMIFLVITIPLATAVVAQPELASADLEKQKQALKEKVQEIQEGGPRGIEGIIGEDILITVDSYQPKILRTSLLEDQSAFVYALLKGTPTNPSITIPRITNLVVRQAKVATVPPGKPAAVGGIKYIPPADRVISYDNMGYIIIPVRQIPREADVPNEITIDVDAQIFFDVSEGLTFGPLHDILTAENEDEWQKDRDQHSFSQGFIRASDVSSDEATFVLYDQNFNEITRPIRLKQGQSSGTIRPYSTTFNYGSVFDRFTVRLDTITSRSDKVKMIINRKGTPSIITLSKGEDLFKGSSWFVNDITKIEDASGAKTIKVTLKDKSGKSKPVTLEATQKKPEETTFVETTPTNSKEIAENLNVNTLVQHYLDVTNGADDIEKGYKNYKLELADITSMLDDPEAPAASKTKALELLKNIKAYYTEKNIEYLSSKETTRVTSSITEDYNIVVALLQKYEPSARTTETATKESYNSYVDLYKHAIGEYEKLLSPKYTDILLDQGQKQYSPAALATWRAANLYLNKEIGEADTAKAMLNNLLTKYDEKNFNGFTKQEVKTLFDLLNSRISDYQAAITTLGEPTTEESFTAILVGVDTINPDAQPTVTLDLPGVSTDTYKQSAILKLPGTNKYQWEVFEINGNTVTLRKTGTNDKMSIKDRGKIQVNPSEYQEVVVKKIDTQYEAHITIAPDTERAFTESHFTLHIPIEKRPFGLPLFSSSLDQEIAKTQEVLDKLNKIIDNLEKITEYWKKLCFITFGVLWLKNLVSGTTAIARSKLSDTWHDKYTDYQSLPESDTKSCKHLTYDECIFKNQNDYDKDLETSEKVIDDINNGKYNKNIYTNLGPEYDTTRKDLEYYSKFNDQESRQKFYEKLTALQRASIEKDFNDKYFQNNGYIKDYDKLDANKVEEFFKKYPGYQDLEKQRKAPENVINDYKYLWQKYGDQIVAAERQETINKDITNYFNQIGGKAKEDQPYENYILNSKYDVKIIQDLQQAYAPAPTANQLEIPRYNIRYDGNEKKYYVMVNNDKLDVPEGLQAKSVKSGNVEYQFVDKIQEEKLHLPKVTLYDEGSQSGRVEFLSLDAKNYVQATYATGGRIEKLDLYQRTSNNGELGGKNDRYYSTVDNQLLSQLKTSDPNLYAKVSRAQSCVSAINKKASLNKYSRGETIPTADAVDCSGLGGPYQYTVGSSAFAATASCTDYMTPSDCKVLFNACDPVICPPSRCNLGGEWNVPNVVQSGIIGSIALCLPNAFKPNIVPICVTGILAGLENIRSIIEGYLQCLKTAKVEGKYVGICDRIRNFGICEILWKEAIAIFNVKKGLIGGLAKLFGADVGGGEYSGFDNAVKNSVGGLQYFTQSYAKDTFAMYSGGSLPEIGANICKSAIYGKVPGVGNFFNTVTKPESPPQFNAFFDEAPYSDIPDRPLSQYKIFYHIYAGENQDISYSVYLESRGPTGEATQPPIFVKDSHNRITRNLRLPKGQISSESVDAVLPSGYDKICVEIASLTYGVRPECGFGKVSTNYVINKLTDDFTRSELTKQINTADECVPASNSIYEEGVVRGTIGTVNSGFLETGIIRKCSAFNPDVGTNEHNWAPAGICGKDERGRDLGTCWLFTKNAAQLIKEVSARENFQNTLNDTALKVIKEAEARGEKVPGFEILTEQQTKELFNQAQTLVEQGKQQQDALSFQKALEAYQRIIASSFVNEKDNAKAQLEIAKTYETWANVEKLKVKPVVPFTQAAIQTIQQPEIKDKLNELNNNIKETFGEVPKKLPEETFNGEDLGKIKDKLNELNSGLEKISASLEENKLEIPKTESLQLKKSIEDAKVKTETECSKCRECAPQECRDIVRLLEQLNNNLEKIDQSDSLFPKECSDCPDCTSEKCHANGMCYLGIEYKYLGFIGPHPACFDCTKVNECLDLSNDVQRCNDNYCLITKDRTCYFNTDHEVCEQAQALAGVTDVRANYLPNKLTIQIAFTKEFQYKTVDLDLYFLKEGKLVTAISRKSNAINEGTKQLTIMINPSTIKELQGELKEYTIKVRTSIPNTGLQDLKQILFKQ